MAPATNTYLEISTDSIQLLLSNMFKMAVNWSSSMRSITIISGGQACKELEETRLHMARALRGPNIVPIGFITDTVSSEDNNRFVPVSSETLSPKGKAL